MVPLWLVLAVGAALVGTMLAPARAATVDPVVRREIRFLQFNICGAICNGGAVDGPGGDVVEHVRDEILAARPHLVVLNEICDGQLTRLRRLLDRSGRPMAGAFHAQRQDARCDGGRAGFGDAVLSSGPIGSRQVHRLPNHPGGGERRSLLCLSTTVGGRRLVACGLHLVAADPEWNARQLDEVVREVRRRSRSATLVVAGDFNEVPSGMGPLIDGRRGGVFDDVDGDRRRPTHGGRKIDYVLLDRRAFRVVDADVRTSRWSDHRILVGRAVLR